jgi:hypothetical protein
MATDTARNQAAMQLPPLLGQYLNWRRRFDDSLAITAISLSAARRLGDRRREADALTSMGIVLWQVRRFDQAITAHQDAAAIFCQTGDRHSQGMTLSNLGLALRGSKSPGHCRAAAVTPLPRQRSRHAVGPLQP